MKPKIKESFVVYEYAAKVKLTQQTFRASLQKRFP